jgi:hypothetical protein
MEMSMMTKGSVIPLYKAMSPEDQQTFKGWAKANLVLASIFAGGICCRRDG